MLALTGVLVAPAVLWGWVFYHAHRYRKVHLALLTLLFIGGFASGMLALLLNHAVEKFTLFWPGAQQPRLDILGLSVAWHSMGFWMLVGANEELAKLVLLLLAVFPSRRLEDPFDGILYVAVIALGFATVENWFYLEQYGIPVIVTRSFITLPAHAFMSVPMGYCVALSRMRLDDAPAERFAYHRPLMIILMGWFLSMLLHGGYDLLLSLQLDGLAYALILGMVGISTWLGRKALRASKFAPRHLTKKAERTEATSSPV